MLFGGPNIKASMLPAMAKPKTKVQPPLDLQLLTYAMQSVRGPVQRTLHSALHTLQTIEAY